MLTDVGSSGEMESALTSPHVPQSSLRRILGPRPALLSVAAVLLVALLVAFGYILTRTREDSRHQAEQHFNSQAALMAELTASLVSTSATASEAAAAKAFGGSTIDPSAFAPLLKTPSVKYVSILDDHGKTIASSPGAPSRPSENALGAHVLSALGGRPSLSDLFTGPGKSHTLEWAVPFKTPNGRRVEIEGFEAKPISTFLNGYLGKDQDGNNLAFVLDSKNRLIGRSGSTLKLADQPKATKLLDALATKTHGSYSYNGVTRYFSSAPVSGSTWRVVLSSRASLVYPSLAGSRSWIPYSVLVAFALAGVASLVLLRRALVTGAALAGTNVELRTINETLEQRVAERTAVAEERARELARSNEELEQFSSVASHDLQEPLRKIRMFGDRLRDRLGADLGGEPAEDLARMQNAAVRMQRLINDLLDYSRVTYRGREFERVDLRKVTEEVVADLEARVVELDADVEVGELPTVEADQSQIRQLMQNLIGNALKFHRDDEPPVIRISGAVIKGDAPRFDGELTATDRCVITVADNGIGFDDKHAERIFTAFERLHGRSLYEGTGIGLSIARKIVWRHGGDLTGKGVPGEGATFTVTLPLLQPKNRNGRPA